MTSTILFPGQGAQALGMGLDIAEGVPAARAIFDEAADVLDYDLAAIIAGDDASALNRTDVCQPAILVTSLAILAAAESRDALDREAVATVAGLSLGEYTALTWAGALDLTDAVRLVALRGEAMQRASEERPSGMLSLVGATPEAATALCDAAREDGVLVLANLLAPGQIAIAGSSDAIDRAEAQLRDHGIRKGVRLAVAGAFHSPCMASAADALSAALGSAPLRAPRIPVVMNVSAEATTDPDTIRNLLGRQIISPVLWQASMERLLADGVSDFFEPGPGKQLTNMLRRYDAETTVTICNDLGALDALTRWPAATEETQA